MKKIHIHSTKLQPVFLKDIIIMICFWKKSDVCVWKRAKHRPNRLSHGRMREKMLTSQKIALCMSSSVSCRSPVWSRAPWQSKHQESRVIGDSKRQKTGRLTQFKQLDSSEVAPLPQPSQTQLIWEHGNWREQTISLAPSSMRLCFTPCKKHRLWHDTRNAWKKVALPTITKTTQNPRNIATQVTIGYIGKKTLKRNSMTCQRNRGNTESKKNVR